MKLEKISIDIPCFSGFYNSYWNLAEYDLESEYDYIAEQRSGNDLDLLDFNDLEINLDQIAINELVGDHYSDEIYEILKDYVTSITYDKIRSPKEYNFMTDEIESFVELSEQNKKDIFGYLNNNIESFDSYITEKHSSRSGFISFFSNNYIEWLENFKAWKFQDIEIEISSILNFMVMSLEDQTSDQVDYDILGSINDFFIGAFIDSYTYKNNIVSFEDLTEKSKNELEEMIL